MNELIKIMPNVKKFNDYIQDVKSNKTPIMLSGLTDVGKVHLAYATSFFAEKPICIITYNELQAKKLMKDFNFFEQQIDYFPKREIVTFDYVAESKNVLFDRISVLNNIKENKTKILITTIEAVLQKMILKENLYRNILKLKTGDTINLDKIKEKLLSLRL